MRGIYYQPTVTTDLQLNSSDNEAGTFLNKGGQRGPQLSVLTPGRWRINRYLWDYEEKDAKEVKAGFVGVVK